MKATRNAMRLEFFVKFKSPNKHYNIFTA